MHFSLDHRQSTIYRTGASLKRQYIKQRLLRWILRSANSRSTTSKCYCSGLRFVVVHRLLHVSRFQIPSPAAASTVIPGHRTLKYGERLCCQNWVCPNPFHTFSSSPLPLSPWSSPLFPFIPTPLSLAPSFFRFPQWQRGFYVKRERKSGIPDRDGATALNDSHRLQRTKERYHKQLTESTWNAVETGLSLLPAPVSSAALPPAPTPAKPFHNARLPSSMHGVKPCVWFAASQNWLQTTEVNSSLKQHVANSDAKNSLAFTQVSFACAWLSASKQSMLAL